MYVIFMGILIIYLTNTTYFRFSNELSRSGSFVDDRNADVVHVMIELDIFVYKTI